ncbi:MAG: methyltransferase domain-containing protein [Candidatus Buchananbacteria bacterium]
MTSQYDKIAETYSSDERTKHPQRKYRIYPSFLALCGDLRNKKVLDLGCGSGFSSRLLAENGAVVTGIDNSEKMLAMAKEYEIQKPPGIKYQLIDGDQKYAFDEKFDLVTAAYFFHYASSEQQLKKFFLNAAGNLKSGGKLVAINNNPQNPAADYKLGCESAGKWLGEPFKDGSAILTILYDQNDNKICEFVNYCWSQKIYDNAMAEAGFEDTKWYDIKISEESKKYSPNWKELEKDPIVKTFTATKK